MMRPLLTLERRMKKKAYWRSFQGLREGAATAEETHYEDPGFTGTINGFPMGRVKNCENSMYYILANNFSDFRNERSALQQMIEDELDGTFIALPKYHCELNPIEYIWGSGKRTFRRINDHTWGGLRLRAKNCFLQIPRETVPKHFRKARDFMRSLSSGHDSTTMYSYVRENCKEARKLGKCHWRPPQSLIT